MCVVALLVAVVVVMVNMKVVMIVIKDMGVIVSRQFHGFLLIQVCVRAAVCCDNTERTNENHAPSRRETVRDYCRRSNGFLSATANQYSVNQSINHPTNHSMRWIHQSMYRQHVNHSKHHYTKQSTTGRAKEISIIHHVSKYVHTMYYTEIFPTVMLHTAPVHPHNSHAPTSQGRKIYTPLPLRFELGHARLGIANARAMATSSSWRDPC